MTETVKITHKKHQVAPIAEVWECRQTRNKSLHAIGEFCPGEVLFSFGAREILAKPNYLSVQLDKNRHILLDPEWLQYINHSCDPNVDFDTTEMRVTALRQINTGEELTFFYPSTEWSMDRAFKCHCGSQACLGKIEGAGQLPREILGKYRLSQHIKHQLGI